MDEVIGIFSTINGDKEIRRGVIFEYDKGIQEAKDYGVGCLTCKYKVGNRCCCKQRSVFLSGKTRVYWNCDLYIDLDCDENFDDRNICEFYKTKAWHNSIRTIAGDFALCYLQYSEKEKKNTYKRFENVFEAFEYSMKKAKEHQDKELERILTISDGMFKRKDEYEEQGEFLSFIKREIPEVYRELRKEFERRKQYGW